MHGILASTNLAILLRGLCKRVIPLVISIFVLLEMPSAFFEMIHMRIASLDDLA